MDFVIKYKNTQNITGVIATNDANVNTGFAGGGGLEGFNMGITAAGAETALTADSEVMPITLTLPIKQNIKPKTKTIDYWFTVGGAANAHPKVIKITNDALGLNSNEIVNAIISINVIKTNGDVYLYPSDLFSCVYKRTKKAFNIAWPNDHDNMYRGNGIRITFSYMSSIE